MNHIDGWLYSIETAVDGEPTKAFAGIQAGTNVTLLVSASLQSRSYAFPRSVVDIDKDVLKNQVQVNDKLMGT